jgi:hypothetical protein
MRRPLTPASIDEKTYPDDKKDHSGEHTGVSAHPFPPELPARTSQSASDGRKKSLGTRLKDKVTGTTQEERQRDRERRAEEELRYYEAHQQFRAAVVQASRTGQPQPLGKDAQGHDIYVLPPQNPYAGYGGFGGYGRNTIAPSPVYNNPNARFLPPPGQYQRPYGGYGYGYGGRPGIGLPILGGLAGGALLGGLLF